MQTRIFLILSAILLSLLEAKGRNADLHELMAQEEYISCSIMTVGPGDEIYSSGGHMAIRMNCPSQNVDYTYEFDAIAGSNGSFTSDFLNGTLKGGYQRLYTDDFLAKANYEGRYVGEYSLSLSPEQEVSLWSALDNAVDTRRVYPFTPDSYNCCSMLMLIVQNSSGINLFADSDGGVLPQDYGRYYIEDCFGNSQWVGLFWNVLLDSDFDRSRQPLFLLYPKNTPQYLSTIQNPLTGKPLILNPDVASTVFLDTKYHPFTPTVFFLIVLGLALALSIPAVKKKFKTMCSVFDCFLLFLTSSVGSVLWYMFFSSLIHPPVYLNVLMLIFNPGPIILLIIGRKKYWLAYAYAESALCLMLIAGILFFPQLRHYGLWIFVLTLLIRGLSLIFSDNKMKFQPFKLLEKI